MGMKEVMHEACEPVKNAVTTAKKQDPNASVKNAGTQRKGGVNEQRNISGSSTPNPRKTSRGQGY